MQRRVLLLFGANRCCDHFQVAPHRGLMRSCLAVVKNACSLHFAWQCMAQSSTKHSSQTLGKRKIPAYICIHFVKAEFAQVHQWEQTHGERRFRFQTSWNQIHLVLGHPTWQEAIFNVWQCHSRAVGGRSEKYNYIKPHTYKYILFGVSVLYMKYFVIVYVYINK